MGSPTCPYCMQRADRCACEDPRIVGYENATPTPPAPADDLAWLLETADQSHRYLVEGRPGHPAHMTSDPWKATRFKTREAAALKFAMIGTGTLAALGIPNDLRPVEHGFAQPAPAADARPMVTGGGLIKFDRRADDARRCCESPVLVCATCGTAQGYGGPAPADDAGGAVGRVTRTLREQYGHVVKYGHDAVASEIVAMLLPLPARDDAVEEAARRAQSRADKMAAEVRAILNRLPCHITAGDSHTKDQRATCHVCSAKDALDAALRRAHGGPPERSDGGHKAQGRGGA